MHDQYKRINFLAEAEFDGASARAVVEIDAAEAYIIVDLANNVATGSAPLAVTRRTRWLGDDLRKLAVNEQADRVHVSSTEYWFSSTVKENGATITSEPQSIADLAAHFGISYSQQEGDRAAPERVGAVT